VVADTEAICDRALKLIEIDWEVLPFITDWDEALKPGAPLLRPDLNPENNVNRQRSTRQGDVEKGFTESSRIIEFQMTDEEDNSTCVEAHACVAEWQGEYLEVWYHGQQPLGVYTSLANAGYTSKDKISVNTPYLGRQFGGSIGPRLWGIRATLRIMHRRSPEDGKTGQSSFDESHFHGGRKPTEHTNSRWDPGRRKGQRRQGRNGMGAAGQARHHLRKFVRDLPFPICFPRNHSSFEQAG